MRTSHCAGEPYQHELKPRKRGTFMSQKSSKVSRASLRHDPERIVTRVGFAQKRSNPVETAFFIADQLGPTTLRARYRRVIAQIP